LWCDERAFSCVFVGFFEGGGRKSGCFVMVKLWFLCGDWEQKRGGSMQVFERRKTCHFLNIFFLEFPKWEKSKNACDPNQAIYRNSARQIAFRTTTPP
jgi:hypothetical protein